MEYKTISLKDEFPFLGEDGRNPSVTMYLPTNLESMGRQDVKHPCIVVCPGGGYFMCSDRETEPIALQFLPEGFHVFVLHYSVAPHRFPNQLREVAAVLELIRRNADCWHCDVNRIAIMGFSAGGHLAAHYANAYRIPEVREVFPDSRPVQATVLCYPVITAVPEKTHVDSFTNLTGRQPLSNGQMELLSCERLVTDQTPPAFLWHTASDELVPVVNSLLYAQSLSEHHVPFELHIYPEGPHGLSTATGLTCSDLPENVRINASWVNSARVWLRNILK